MEADARPHRYTPEQRDAALELYSEVAHPRRDGGSASRPGPCARGRGATAELAVGDVIAVPR